VIAQYVEKNRGPVLQFQTFKVYVLRIVQSSIETNCESLQHPVPFSHSLTIASQRKSILIPLLLIHPLMNSSIDTYKEWFFQIKEALQNRNGHRVKILIENAVLHLFMIKLIYH
jgi:hypothetical protein